MLWTILLVRQKDNDWFVNYIKNKLTKQVNNLNLQKKIEVVVSDILPTKFGNYISIIDELIEITDDFITTIYNILKTSTKECICLKGKVVIDNNTFIFNNITYINDEIYLPITKLNPIKKEIVLNIKDYLNIDNLSFVKNSDNVDKIIVFKEKVNKEPISIIITAYKSQDFIEECLDSIENQSYFLNNNNFEVLVGVDGCRDTYNKLNEIKHKYRNLNIYMMSENKGTYITTNKLIDLTKYDNIIRFDSDDIMKPELVKEVFKNKNDNDLLVLGSLDIKNGKIGRNFLVTPGSIYFKKDVMNIAGGYRPWLCAADSELIFRLKGKIKMSNINTALFYRRIHDNSLTSKPETGYGSTLRKEYITQINQYISNVKIKKEVNRILENNVIKKSNIKIAFGMIVFNGDYVLKECLESIYPYANQILIAEGPVTYWQKKGFTTSTDKTNEIIDNFPDPDNKISIIHSQYSEKDAQANAYMKFLREDNDYIWNIDSDEIFKGEDIEKIIDELIKEKYTTVRFIAYSFFGGFDKYISGYESSLPYVRIRKLYPGSYWFTHRPPTLKHVISNVLPEKPLDANKLGIYMYHYSHVFPDQVYEKIRYYGESLRPTKIISNYFEEVYLPWVLGDNNKKNEIEKKFNGVDENIKKDSNTKFFGGQHPKVISDNFDKLKKKFETQLKKYNSAEFKLSLVKNTTTTTTVAPTTTTSTTVLPSTTTSTTLPILINLSSTNNNSYNLIMMITTYNRVSFLKKTIESWYFTCDKRHKWTLIVADDGSDDGTLEYLYNLNLKDIKILIIENKNRGVHHQTNSMLKLALNMDFDYGFKIDDDLIFFKENWDNLYINASILTGYYHLIFYDKKWGERRKEKRNSIFKDSILENSVSPENIQGAFWTFNKDVIKKVGYFDTKIYNLCGIGHVDYSLRCCRLGFNELKNPYDIIDSNSYIILNKEKYFSNNNFRNFWNTNEIIISKKQNLFKNRDYVEYNELDKNLKNENLNLYDISFIIPLRGREDQIEGLEFNLAQFFSEYNYEIIYVNQNDNNLFKRGQLCNIGFKECKGDIIIFQDVDIRHLRKIDIKKLLDSFGSPFVGFDKITQLNETKLGNYEIIETEKRPCGWGAFAIFNREQFILSGGFSNLIFGWGVEDTIMNDRINYMRFIQDLGHVYHTPSRKNVNIFNSKWYKNNKMIWQTNKDRDKYKDGFIQTLYSKEIEQKNDNIKIVNVNKIYVPDNYEYIDLYNKIKEDTQ